MDKNLKIQTMSDDLDKLKSGSQKPSQQAEEEKEKTIAKTVGVGNVAEQINSKKSTVESVISSMINGEIGGDKQKKNETGVAKIKGGEKSRDGDVGELQSLVSRISKVVPEEEFSSTITKREEVSSQEKLPEPNIESVSKETEEKISREIDKEMEARINKEIGEKIKNEAEVVTAANLEAGKDINSNKEEKKNQKSEDAEKLKSLISRISKTAEKEDMKESVVKKTGEKTRNSLQSSAERGRGEAPEELKKIKENKTEESVILDDKKDNVAKMPLAGEIQKKLPSELSGKIENQEKKSFWGNISEKLKKDSDHKKISKVKTDQNKKILENKIEKHNKSGILTENKEKVKETKKDKGFYLKSGEYVLPENRLIHGKQKFYSSVSKRIKLRKDKGEMEGLKNVSDMKEKQKILSREEEYKKLKKSIRSKYHIKLFQLPWKKIIPVSLIIILMATASFYYVMSILVPKPIYQPPSDAAFGEELSEFMSIEKKITISEGSLRGLNKGNLEENARDIFNKNRKLKVIKLVIVDTEDKEGRNILLLKDSFGALSIIDTENNKNNLPENFLEMSTDKYNFFVFKTKNNRIRYGVAIGLKDRYFMSEIMKEWEGERSANKKMSTVFKPLFASDRNYEDIYNPFNSANYNGIEIKYVHLVNEDTALNYFIYNNNEEGGNDLLVVTTSKDSTYAIVDLLMDKR